MRFRVLAAAVGDTATAPQVSGFVQSPFNPLVHQVATACLTRIPGNGLRTAVVLASELGDSVTTDLASRLLTGGQPHNALLFMQATANAILGQMSIEHRITGPLLSISPAACPDSGPFDLAHLLLPDEADRVLVIGVELSGTDRTVALHHARGEDPPTADLAGALLLERGSGTEIPPVHTVHQLVALARSVTTTASLGGVEGGQA